MRDFVNVMNVNIFIYRSQESYVHYYNVYDYNNVLNLLHTA